MKCAREFRAICETLVAELRARGPPQPCDTSIGAQLLRARDAATGQLHLRGDCLMSRLLHWGIVDLKHHSMAAQCACRYASDDLCPGARADLTPRLMGCAM